MRLGSRIGWHRNLRRFTAALVSMLITAFAEVTAERADATATLADRILAYALANLADPAFSARTVARQLSTLSWLVRRANG